MIKRRMFRSVVVGAAGLLVIPFVSAPASAAAPLVVIPDTAPTWATPANVAGTPAAGAKVSIRVALQLRDAQSAESLVQGVSDPSSKSYGKYVTPDQFNSRFAPTTDSVNRVEGFLRSSGLTVSGVAAGNRWVTATGTVAQLDKAFATTLRTYSRPGADLRAPASDLKIPSSIAADVLTVTGLTQDATLRTPQTRRVVPDAPGAKPAAKSRTAAPSATRPPASKCSDYWGEYQQTLPPAFGRTSFNTYICGYSPAQLRKAYGTDGAVAVGTTGQGVTVAIIDAYASPTMLSDANAYAANFGEPAFTAGQYTETTFGPFNLQDECGGEGGWNGEETLDVEAVHGMAPGANIHYIGAQNCDTGIDDALNYVVQNHTADIISNSYGNQGEDIPGEIAVEHAIVLQAALEGIGMYFSSGDSGDEVVNGLTPQPDYPASDPLVTAVGGTSLLLDKHNNTVAELGWETSLDFVDYTGPTAVYSDALPGDFVFGAGGGISSVFTQPFYQRGVVPDSLARNGGSTKMRVVPDISADADPYTGFYIGETVDGVFGISSIGGTSLSAPTIAGIQALASQHRLFPIGFANPLLYHIDRYAFSDVVSHRPVHFASVSGAYLGTFDTGDTQTTTRGYDDTTGRGTPNGIAYLLSVIFFPFRF